MSRREFHFTEGGSSKFWAIEVDGPRFTVQYGRLGTAGQAQTKEFKSDAEANKAADKLIAEKTKKGYAEVGSAAAPAAPAAKPARVKAKAAPPPSPPAAPAGPAALAVTRRIDFEAPDWLCPPGRPWPLLPRPELTPFDLEGCLGRFRRCIGGVLGGQTDWKKAAVSPVLTPPEASFWLTAFRQPADSWGKDTTDVIARMHKDDYDKPLGEKEAVKLLRERDTTLPADVALPLFHLLPLESFTDLLLTRKLVTKYGHFVPAVLLAGFRQHVLPFITDKEAAVMRKLVRPHLDPKDYSDDVGFVPWCLAAYLGMSAELAPLVAGWPDGKLEHGAAPWLQESGETATVLVLNLPEPAQVVSETRRLRMLVQLPDAVAAWAIRTQCHALDVVRDSILAVTRKDRAEKLTATLAQVQAPEVAPQMLQLSLESKAGGPARQWLDDNPGNAIAGLIPVAAGQGKLAAAAVEYLRAAARKGQGQFIADQLKAAPAANAARVKEALAERQEPAYEFLDMRKAPPPLRDSFARALAPAPLVSWATPANFPPALVGGRRLTDEQVLTVLNALRRSLLGAPDPLLPALKQHADRPSLDAFVWRLFETWLANGAPSKEKWAFLALGHLGADAVALKLTPLLRAWPGEGQHQRAVTGLECLRAIGTDTALIQLNGIAQKLKFKGLQNKAREFMEAIAKDRGLTREQLEDRIVPDLDLDQRGTRVFDFGPRRFEVVLGPDLRPLVRDEERKLREDLPKPGAKDDAAKAEAAVADWKVLKKALREAVKVQAFRLEQAMVVGRRWTPDEFQTLLVQHPLMVNLVRRLLWGGYDGKGKLARTFRVTEEGEHADADDRPCTLDKLASVGVVHPLHLSVAGRARWGEVFADYEIIAPFPQLGRPLYGLEGDEAKGHEITRFADKKVPGVSVASYLEKSGWQRGHVHDHGDFHEHVKHFPSANVTAVTQYEGDLWVSNIADPVKIVIKSCTFWEGLFVTDFDWYQRVKKNKPLKLSEVDPVVVSEVLADLTFLATKAE
jgi:predicted DNA-binding WGR domain protein